MNVVVLGFQLGVGATLGFYATRLVLGFVFYVARGVWELSGGKVVDPVEEIIEELKGRG